MLTRSYWTLACTKITSQTLPASTYLEGMNVGVWRVIGKWKEFASKVGVMERGEDGRGPI